MRPRVSIQVFSSMIVGFLPCLAPAELVAVWDFDTSISQDRLSRHQQNLVHGQPQLVNGRQSGKCLHLDDKDHIIIQSSPRLAHLERISIGAWIKFDRGHVKTSYETVIAKGDTSWRLQRFRDTSYMQFACSGVEPRDPYYAVEGSIKVDDGKWHHVVGTYDGMNIYLYVDGILDNQKPATGSIHTNTIPIAIGENLQAKGRHFKGMIDELVIFDHGMTDQEVARLYHGGFASFLRTCYSSTYVGQTEKAIAGLSAPKAIRILKDRILAYSQWINQQSKVQRHSDRSVPADLWYLLAQHLERAGRARPEVLSIYCRAVRGVHDKSKYFPQALAWLYEQGDSIVFKTNVRDLFQTSYMPLHSIEMTTTFMSSIRNWEAFRLVLDVLFSEAFPDGLSKESSMQTIQAVLKDDPWSKTFMGYCHESDYLSDVLSGQQERLLNRQLAEGRFTEATKLHSAFAQQCQIPQRITEFDYSYCRLLYESENYIPFLQHAAAFMDKYGKSYGYLCNKMAMMMAMAFSKTGDTSQASHLFFKVMLDRPQSIDSIKASYYLGYCAMLDGDYDKALHYFQYHIQSHPNSPYFDKAKNSISRIEQVAAVP